ncbi:F-box/kelch-repeat protein At1g57790-like [Papaver somniferum]|uniref:F-box/kelch-repeat protein At1g57790-like n=1 Tax=Papaver somniferum TaxID=3469 RepID=UPI000E6F74B9|nr:F-box/kelch-repeat protein At1g57790-like [Papaver somniferum]
MIMGGADSWEWYVSPNADIKKFMPLCNITPVLYKKVIYCVDNNGTLGAFDPTCDDNPWSVLTNPSKQFDDDMHPGFLVECGKDLLLVKLGHVGKLVRILRLDLSEMKWVKVETLGKRMLFISSTTCVSAVAPNRDMENKIYFPRLCLNGEGILVYSLETCSYHSSGGKQQLPVNNFYETEGWLSNCTWIQPNWSKSTPQELDWFKPQKVPG